MGPLNPGSMRNPTYLEIIIDIHLHAYQKCHLKTEGNSNQIQILCDNCQYNKEVDTEADIK